MKETVEDRRFSVIQMFVLLHSRTYRKRVPYGVAGEEVALKNGK